MQAPAQLHFQRWRRNPTPTQSIIVLETFLESDSGRLVRCPRQDTHGTLSWPCRDSDASSRPQEPTYINGMSGDKLGCSHGLPAKGDPELHRRQLLAAREVLRGRGGQSMVLHQPLTLRAEQASGPQVPPRRSAGSACFPQRPLSVLPDAPGCEEEEDNAVM